MIAVAAAAAGAEKISAPMKYDGYTAKQYGDYKLVSKYVEMSDGVKLAVDIYFPRKGPRRETFPVVVEYTPYSRAYANPAFKSLDGKKSRNLMGGRGAVIPMPFCFDMDLIAHGYVLVIADIRGSGASFGSRFDMTPKIGTDGAELIEWIAAQPWCDGNVGMKGGSYMAISQILTAANKPPHLKGIFIMIYPFGFQDLYAGGVYNAGFMKSFSDMIWTMNMNMRRTVGSFPVMPAAPVVDEDGDGKMLDEIPIDKDGDGAFYDDYNYPADPDDPPQYEDGAQREHIYYLATKDHENNLKIHEWFSRAKFLDTTAAELGLAGEYGDFDGYDINPSSSVPAVMDFGIPIYHLSGWMDAQVRSAFLFYSTARKTNPSRIMVQAGYHIMSSPFYEYFGDNNRTFSKGVKTEQLRFFDRYLKGIENGIEDEDPVALYVMGEGVRQESAWPLEREKPTDFFFGADGSLSTAAGDPGADEYTADFSHDSSFGPNHGNRWKMYIIPTEVPDRAEHDSKCLTYTTPPLEEDTEITGHPIVDMWVSSTADYGDFFVYLSDVTPEGKVVLVTEQPMRAGFAGLKDNDTIVGPEPAGVDVLPDLPWHGYTKADYVDGIFKDGNIVNLKFDLQPTSWIFKKGHSIRVSIAAADWPTFDLHEKLSPANDPAAPDNIVPTITVHRDAGRSSKIVLPVID